MWKEVFLPETPLPEIFVRGTVVYLAIFFMLRFTPRREVGSFSTTNLIVIVIIADAAQNAMAGKYHSITDGLLLVATIIGWSIVLDAAAFRWPVIARVVKPPPRVLIRDGRLDRRNLRRELITEDELMAHLREQGTDDVSELNVVLEPDGRVSVRRQDDGRSYGS
ncbi:DUF421 domain-containing protein [Sphaerimonospora thailandensis]|uniref:DUF421 domain-containing protein n=1 Tax=Sphaerimonospora thailandensis TaxID=795644 RepID=A0A8J3R992_9ACTN|nr:YetF domain-containing protein [Sphaerimonospora thailandensis]GIH69729.1 DUF421 domain-containing protein [Sphaerimonospora thailandensis]